ncbi:MAG: NACHT domain-containing protein [Chloroflexaceae bacterium]|nr:NACHT domain-containing protein [Chloroflexaceae bacterium]
MGNNENKPAFGQDDQQIDTRNTPVWPINLTPTDTQQHQNRLGMLEKMRTYWIEGFLDQSLHKAVLLELKMEYKPDALAYPGTMLVQQSDQPGTPVPAGTTIATVFDQCSGQLLILGSPGSGKTTMLLELARTLIRRAEDQDALPIPVVFHLASWVQQRYQFDTWLMEELNSLYDVPKAVAQTWLNANEILPLLDGLNEVPADQREACIAAINDYTAQQAQGGMPVVVCSRLADYDVLTRKLQLQGAVLLPPLTDQQMDAAIQQLGNRAEPVASVLRTLRESAQQHADTAAEELARTPLLLHVATLAYQGDDTSQRPSPEAPPAAQQHQLFQAYVDRMCEQSDENTPYTPQQTQHWLRWLAGRLHQNHQIMFQLERMQPWWLHRSSQRGLYVLGSAIVAGAGALLLGPLFSLLLALVIIAGLAGLLQLVLPLGGMVDGQMGFVLVLEWASG